MKRRRKVGNESVMKLRREDVLRQRLTMLAMVCILSAVLPTSLSFFIPHRTFVVLTSSMIPTLNPGDLLITHPATDELANGTIIVFKSPFGGFEAHRIIGRVAAGNDLLYLTKGDANNETDSFLVTKESIVGTVSIIIPKLGFYFLIPREIALGATMSLIGTYLLLSFRSSRIEITEEPESNDEKKNKKRRKLHLRHISIFCLLIGGLLLQSIIPTQSSVLLTYPISSNTLSVKSPSVVLQQGNAGSSTIRDNGVNANVSIAAPLIGVGWYSGSWPFRKKITIYHSNIVSNLTNFPVLISLSTDNALASHAQSNGNDILFTSSDGTTKLSHEIEKYTSSTGLLVAWIKIPTLSSTVDTVIYMYYGNPSSTNQQSSASVWSNYIAVYHFEDGSGSKITDSTLQHNATLYGGGSHWTNGKIGGGYNFDGTNDYAVIAASAAFDTSTYTIEAWVRPSTPQTWADIMGQNDTTNGPTKFQFAAGTASTNLASDFGKNNDWHTLEAAGALSNNAWNSYVDRIDIANTNQSLWKNGKIVASQTQTAHPCNYANGSAIGIGSDAFGAYKFKGIIDELRFSSIALSANWIKTEYNNQNNPGSFYYVGSEEAYTFDYVLKIANQIPQPWKVYLKVYSSSNLGRISSATMGFHDGSASTQIIVSSGVLTQSQGSQYDLTASATIYISISSLQASTTGTTYLYIYLVSLVQSSSPYILYTITFQIT